MNKQKGILILIITNQCNLRCSYCYEHNRENSVISFETAKENIANVLDNDKKYESMDIYLFGGEPFLEFDRLKEICEWTWSREWRVPYIFTVNTNGTVLSSEIKTWLSNHREKFYIVLSLDGEKKSQDVNRSNSFDRIDIDFFKENWEDAAVKMTISEQSLPNLYNDVKFIHSKGLLFSDCNLAMGIDWSNLNNCNILKRELKKLLEFYKENKKLIPANIINLEIGGCENQHVMHKWCGVGRELIAVNTDGKKYPCNVINPMCFNDEELDILLNTDFTDIRSLLDKECFETCYIYPLCPTCYATDYSRTKSINKKDKSICNLMKIRAFYSAALKAIKIKNLDIENLTVEEKGKLHKTIVSICKINELYRNV